MTAAQYLPSLGFTVEQARAFIFTHLDDPALLHRMAGQYGITTDMLGEITGHSNQEVRGYFDAHGLDSAALDPAVGFFHDDLLGFAGLLSLDTHSGTLSVDALRDSVIAATNSVDYYDAFNPSGYLGAEDGLFTPDELGAAHLGTLPATTDTLESLFFGTVISFFTAVDPGEALALAMFAALNEEGLDAGDELILGLFIELMLSVAQDPAPIPFFSTSEVAEAAVLAGTLLVELVGAGGAPALFDGLFGGWLP